MADFDIEQGRELEVSTTFKSNIVLFAFIEFD